MKLLIKGVEIIWENSAYHRQKLDILIQDGLIREIEPMLDSKIDVSGVEVWEVANTYLSAGFFDLDTNFGEPGLENREDFITGTNAALRGGFTGVAIMPNTHPPLHSRTEIEYILAKNNHSPIDIFPIGTISKGREGKEMAELFDMFSAGAIAFCDGDRPLLDTGLLLRALQYTSSFGGVIFSYPEDYSLAGSAQVHEGIHALRLGMKGIPPLAEEIMVQRDLMIAAYAGTPIHFLAISTQKSVELIREAKRAGQPVTASTPAYQLFLSDEKLGGFDSNYKVRPPLRSASDLKALIVGIEDGTIDVISSRHTPHEPESKEIEFENALDGIISLETTFSIANMSLLNHKISMDRWIHTLTNKPRDILHIPRPMLKVGEMANFCWFDPSMEWVLEKKDIKSKSYNSPFIHQKLKGKVLGVVQKKHTFKF